MGQGRPPTAKGARHTAVGEAVWKSDEVIVVKKRANKVSASEAAEAVERRTSAKRNPGGRAVVGTQRPAETDVGLIRVREAARADRSLSFNNLLHHVTVDLLERAYWALRRQAAPGGEHAGHAPGVRQPPRRHAAGGVTIPLSEGHGCGAAPVIK